MRKSIAAQSHESMPPAPGWIDRIAFFASCSPDIMSWNSRCSVRSSSAATALSTSCSSSALSTSWAISDAPRASVSIASQGSVAALSTRCSPTVFCAPTLSFQKSGSAIFASRARRRSIRPARSKALLGLADAGAETLDAGFDLGGHGQLGYHRPPGNRESGAGLR
jgi:hypothetical protein